MAHRFNVESLHFEQKRWLTKMHLVLLSYFRCLLDTQYTPKGSTSNNFGNHLLFVINNVVTRSCYVETRLKTLQSKLPDKTTRLKIQSNHKKLNRTLRNLNKTQNLKKPY